MMKSILKELIGASAALIIFSMLKNGDTYGYEIIQKVKKLTNDEIRWKEASIYPVLKKLEKERMIKSYWKVQEGGRNRKYYTLLEDGENQLEQNRREWMLIYSVFKKLQSPDT